MSLITNNAKEEMWTGVIDVINDTIVCMLATASYGPDADHVYLEEAVDDANEHELSGTGYTAGWQASGRKTLASKAIVQDDANDRAEFDCADITWSSIDAGTPDNAVFHKEGAAADTTAQIIAVIDDGGFPIVTNGGDLTLQVNSEGLIHNT